jgi:hypothetical protein
MKEKVKGKINPKEKTRWRLKLKKKTKFEHENEKGEFGGEGDDEGHNTIIDDDYKVEHSWSKGKLRK